MKLHFLPWVIEKVTISGKKLEWKWLALLTAGRKVRPEPRPPRACGLARRQRVAPPWARLLPCAPNAWPLPPKSPVAPSARSSSSFFTSFPVLSRVQGIKTDLYSNRTKRKKYRCDVIYYRYKWLHTKVVCQHKLKTKNLVTGLGLQRSKVLRFGSSQKEH